MEIVYKTLGELTPYENNPRNNDEAVQYVKNSIEKFGFKVPIVIDKDGVIVAGHTRYKASMELDLAQVPCIVADDLTEEEIRAFRLADNKTAEAAQKNFIVEKTGILKDQIYPLRSHWQTISAYGEEIISQMYCRFQMIGLYGIKRMMDYHLASVNWHGQTSEEM